MPKRKPGLSRDEHTTLGAELARMRDRLGTLSVDLNRVYPNAVADEALSAQAGVDRLRSKLDSILFQENPGLSTKDNASVYYPGTPREDR